MSKRPQTKALRADEAGHFADRVLLRFRSSIRPTPPAAAERVSILDSDPTEGEGMEDWAAAPPAAAEGPVTCVCGHNLKSPAHAAVHGAYERGVQNGLQWHADDDAAPPAAEGLDVERLREGIAGLPHRGPTEMESGWWVHEPSLLDLIARLAGEP